MNDHIRQGNEAILQGNRDLAAAEFYLALEDPDQLVQRIARNRLMELFPETVYATTHAGHYHRPNCPAKFATFANRIVWFKDWVEAERNGYKPCPSCRPPRVTPFAAPSP